MFSQLESSKYDCFKNWCEAHQLTPKMSYSSAMMKMISAVPAAGCGVIPADAHVSTHLMRTSFLPVKGVMEPCANFAT